MKARPCIFWCGDQLRDNQRMPASTPIMEKLTAVLYRLAAYASEALIDDAAMLAFIFC